MASGQKKPSSSKLNIVLAYFLFLILLLALFAASAEIILRKMGERPFVVRYPEIVTEPEGRYIIEHDSLGYTNRPGEYKITLPTSYSFTVTHLENNLRATQPVSEYGNGNEKDEIWIFGCSFTYGWSLSDEETFPWLLQQKFPQYEIRNFGVIGFGSVHALIQLQEALKIQKKPKIAVLVYASFHNERNTILRSRKKQLVPYNKGGTIIQPYARFDGDGKLKYEMTRVDYREFPFMRHSALIHYIEKKYNLYEDLFYHSREVTMAIIDEFAALAEENGVTLIMAGITRDDATAEMLEFANGKGVRTVDISVDPEVKEYTNKPHDPHPSAVANINYSERLEPFLKGVIAGQM